MDELREPRRRKASDLLWALGVLLMGLMALLGGEVYYYWPAIADGWNVRLVGFVMTVCGSWMLWRYIHDHKKG